MLNSDKIDENTKFGFSFSQTCDIIGSSSDYYLRMDNDLLNISVEGFEFLLDFINGKKKDVSAEKREKIRRVKSDCSLCGENKNCIRVEKKEFFICERCLHLCKKKCKNGDKYIKYNENSKFKVVSLPDRRLFYDLVSQNMIDSKSFVIFSTDKLIETNRATLSNILKVREGLKEPSNYIFVYRKNNGFCRFCYKEFHDVDGIVFCHSCRESLYSSLDEYIRENKSFVVSNSI